MAIGEAGSPASFCSLLGTRRAGGYATGSGRRVVAQQLVGGSAADRQARCMQAVDGEGVHEMLLVLQQPTVQMCPDLCMLDNAADSAEPVASKLLAHFLSLA